MVKTETKAPVNKHTSRKKDTFFREDGLFTSESQPDLQPFFSPSSWLQSNNKQPQFFDAPAIQTNLKVGQPGDKYEQEADTMADKVVQKLDNNEPETNRRTKRNLIQTKTEKEEEKINRKSAFESDNPSNEQRIQFKTETCHITPAIKKRESNEEKESIQENEDESETESIQRKPIFASDTPPELQSKADHSRTEIKGNLESRINDSKGGGSTLSPETRLSMESAFNADFSNVRIHTGGEAARMNKELGAHAFTHANDIYFSSGKYDTGSSSGRHLLAHELAHTLQQGAVQVRAKVEGLSDFAQPVIQKKGWIQSKIEKGLNWAAERLIPGYTLLNVILGKNLITDEPVERSGVNIIGGYMRLLPVIGSILLNELEETNTLTEAGAWVEIQVKKFGIDFNDVSRRLKLMWDEMSIWEGIEGNILIFKKYISPVLGKLLAFSSVVNEKVKELRFEGALRLVGATELLEALKKDPEALKRIIDNPKLILKYFINAIKKGFEQFRNNFITHFKNALLGWLFGKAAEMGIQIPEKLDIPGLFHLIAQIIGVTYPQIRIQIVKKLGPKGESIVSKMETAVGFVHELATQGPKALWKRVQEGLSNLKEMFFSAITGLVLGEVIKVAVVKLVSMLNPVGAIVQLVLTLYRVIKFFIEWWDTIKEIAQAVISSITYVALSKIEFAANFIEKIMAKGIKLVIAFLAGIFGLSGIVTKVKNLIKKISDPVQKAVGKVIGWIIEKGKKLFAKLTGRGEKKREGKYSDKDKQKALGSFEKEEKPYLKQNSITKENALKVAKKVKKKHPVFKSISVVEGKEDWNYQYIFRAIATTPSKKAEKGEKGINYEQIKHLLDQPAPKKPPDGYEYYDIKTDGSKKIRRLKGKIKEGYVKLAIKPNDVNEVDDHGEDGGYVNVIIEGKEGGTSRISKPGKLARNVGGSQENHQFHHIIPDAIVKNNDLMIMVRKRTNYDLDRKSNGLRMPSNKEGQRITHLPIHYGSHTNYNNKVNNHLNNIYFGLKQKTNLDEIKPKTLELIALAQENRFRKIASNSFPQL